MGTENKVFEEQLKKTALELETAKKQKNTLEQSAGNTERILKEKASLREKCSELEGQKSHLTKKCGELEQQILNMKKLERQIEEQNIATKKQVNELETSKNEIKNLKQQNE